MDSSPTSHPDAADLLAYADTDAPLEVGAHLRDCPACAARLAELSSTEAALGRALYRFDCPNALTLGEYVLDLLEPEQHRLTAAHALECDLCAAELQSLRAYLATDPPLPESLLGRVRRVVATLLTPASGPGLALAGLRGAAESSTRVYQAEGLTISISTGDEPGQLVGLVVADQLAAQQLEGCPVRLLPTTAGAPAQAHIDDLGNFELDGLESGSYTLEVELPDVTVVAEGLQVG